MNRADVQSTLRRMGLILNRPRLWVVFVAVVALFTVTGPFGTYDRLPPAARLGYWLSLLALAWLTCLVFVVCADELLAARIRPDFLRMLVGALAASPAIGLAIMLVDIVMLADRFSWAKLASQIASALPVTFLMCIFAWLTLNGQVPGPDATESLEPERSDRDTLDHTGERETVSPPRLLHRLDVGIRAPILHVSVADHYVDVVTARGHQLVLMRFADALQELDPSDGLRVHRSHWVAVKSVERVLSGGRRLSLKLSTGASVPVSRPYAADVRSRFADRLVQV